MRGHNIFSMPNLQKLSLIITKYSLLSKLQDYPQNPTLYGTVVMLECNEICYRTVSIWSFSIPYEPWSLLECFNRAPDKRGYSKIICPFSQQIHTLKCLSIGTPKILNFPFLSNGKLMVFRCPNIQAHCNEAVLWLKFGTPENNEFSIWDKWKIYYL